MTKDVLVSVTGKHMGIMADGAGDYESEADVLEVVTPGTYYCRNGKHYILYDEVIEGDGGTIRNRIKISGTDSVEIIRTGAANSHMVFERNRQNLTCYQTPFGQMMLSVNTKRMEVSVGEDRIDVQVDYELDVNHEPLSDCDVRIRILPKGSPEFSVLGF